ncbi:MULTISPECIES: dynamin family protein [Cyanophyceae]|uniref:dynamin family protein n=1 Tax=Cyanophyceae TaxID=3028117 RepID=UPI001683CFB3|nr:dynamin family protein [Trichocoleus sp. FACHB-40]MBD2002094.1 dynamin family protein [Trichocoleus sp. FACHB-40]
MSSEQFQAAHDSIYITGRLLLQYLQEIQSKRLAKENDTKCLQSIEEDITKALYALKEHNYQLAVIAPTKTGKSTFLNAIIGADILATEAAACTVCRTDIRHIDVGQVPRFLEYRHGKRQPVVIAEGDGAEIHQKFLERTQYIRNHNNPDHTIRFEIEYPIEAISTLSSLAGFTLIDTPGVANGNREYHYSTELKQITLESLRKCHAILFILDYTSSTESLISDLLRDVMENRQNLLAEKRKNIYFLLNKADKTIDVNTENNDFIKKLEVELAGFGLSNPMIYPASSKKGLLAKLIQGDTAANSHTKEFVKLFLGEYLEENEDGEVRVPQPIEIASKALKDSGITTIQETIIQNLTKNYGWNLISDVLAKLDKAAKAIEDSLNTELKVWGMEIEAFKNQVKEYREKSESVTKKIDLVKNFSEAKKQKLITKLTFEINIFAENAKNEIQKEIERLAHLNTEIGNTTDLKVTQSNVNREITEIPFLGESSIFVINERKATFVEAIKRAVVNLFNSKTDNPHSQVYKLRVATREDAQNIRRAVNEFFGSQIQNWWIDTQDQLIRQGTRSREELVQEIQEQIQQISNEITTSIEEALKIELNINCIQFPSFEFLGIDTEIQSQQEVYARLEKGTITESDRTTSTNVYQVDIPFEDKGDFLEIDLYQIAAQVKLKIDEQVSINQEIFKQVIDRQVTADFRSAEQQIKDYIERFKDEFNYLVSEREKPEADTEEILVNLQAQKKQLNEYLSELNSIRESLNSWKPVLTVV